MAQWTRHPPTERRIRVRISAEIFFFFFFPKEEEKRVIFFFGQYLGLESPAGNFFYFILHVFLVNTRHRAPSRRPGRRPNKEAYNNTTVSAFRCASKHLQAPRTGFLYSCEALPVCVCLEVLKVYNICPRVHTKVPGTLYVRGTLVYVRGGRYRSSSVSLPSHGLSTLSYPCSPNSRSPFRGRGIIA